MLVLGFVHGCAVLFVEVGCGGVDLSCRWGCGGVCHFDTRAHCPGGVCFWPVGAVLTGGVIITECRVDIVVINIKALIQ